MKEISDKELQRKLDEFLKESSSSKPIIKPSFPPEESEFIEIHRHCTPSGGDLSIAYFYDKERKPCKRKDAVYVNIVEYLNNGTRINETYGKMQGDL